jgi:cystathionine beta-lyase/cystathionine gamma-synthase
MRTLFLRVEQASRNALALAKHFEKHPKLAGVLYPGLESHAQHKIARKQMTGGFGGMLSILVKGDEAQTRRVAGRLKVFTPATSLGGVESLAEHRKSVEGPHSIVAANLIRFSIGIEDVADLIADLERTWRKLIPLPQLSGGVPRCLITAAMPTPERRLRSPSQDASSCAVIGSVDGEGAVGNRRAQGQ